MTLTIGEMNLHICRREPIQHRFFQPRFEPWFDWHSQFTNLPPELEDLSLRDTHELVNASMARHTIARPA